MEFYYQIKGKSGDDDYSFGNWAFPPIFSGKVEAENKKEAKEIIESDYNRSFPLRVLKKDLDSNEFLLAIQEIKEGSRFLRLFDEKVCIVCGNQYRIIDKYNDTNCKNKSAEVCSDICRQEEYKVKKIQWNEDNVMNGKHTPVIYKINNKVTGKNYIGKTTQAFTLRWYQHFFQGSGTKFYDEINKYQITDWIFEVIEVVNINHLHNYSEAEKFISEREQHYIDEYNSIDNGYNSIKSNSNNG